MAAKARYLIFFQYCGTRYSGVMKSPSDQTILGVQNYLENAVQKLRPVNEVNIAISSRTDSGVHALCNSAHLDIQRKEGKPPFSAELLVNALNFHLKPEPISVIKAFHVADNFSARFRALSRTYVYRLVTGCWHHSQLPVFERNLCWPVSNTHLKFWELTFRSRSFLYKQVRRMTGALVAVGQGRLMPQHIADLLEMRDSMAYPQNIIAPPDGLFLKNVEYDTKDLEVEESVIQ
ncbi:tRNA pseudouridine synthase-like 1 isoform X4 [Chiloscyllium punctatum]|uniref:tRNA pseudouridine synthase-like 1 isoform X4 n=1 Tax=Chiloscyllium punctatum TaxID=137246 RepID=UPI003B6354FB